MSATTTTPSIEEELSKCAALVASFIGDIKAAGEAIARACDSYDHFLRELKNKLGSNVTITYLRRLERLGRGEICEQIAIGAVPHISFVEKLPRTQQIEVIKNGVKFPEGLGDHRFLRLEVMDYYQAKAAFKGKVIRSLDEIRVA